MSNKIKNDALPTPDEEMAAIREQIKNAQKTEGAKVVIDTDQVQENGVRIHTHEVVPAEGANKAPQTLAKNQGKETTADVEKAPQIENMAVVPPTDDALQFFNLIMDGHDVNSLRVMFKTWKLKRFNRAYEKAQQLIKVAQKEQDDARAEAVSRYNYMYRAASRMGNVKEMRAIQDCICKVQGLWKEGISVGENAQVITLWGGLGAAQQTNK